MSAFDATVATHRHAAPTTRQRAGLVVCGLYSLANVPSVLVPAPAEGETGPPFGILLLATLCGMVGLVATVLAWRGSRPASRVAAGAIIVATVTALPAFFVDVPMWVKALSAASVLVTVLAVVLMFSGPRRDAGVR